MGANRFAIAATAIAAALLAARMPVTAAYQTLSVGIGDRENMVSVPLEAGTDPGAIITLPTYPHSTHAGPPTSDSHLVSAMYASSDSFDAVSTWFKRRLPVSWTSSDVPGAARRTIAFRWSGRGGSQAVLIQAADGKTSIVEATGRFETSSAETKNSVRAAHP